MATHKFRIGQKVHLVVSGFEHFAAPGDYEIKRQLANAHGEFHYRIKSADEPYERVAKEGQLLKSTDELAPSRHADRRVSNENGNEDNANGTPSQPINASRDRGRSKSFN